MQMQGHPVQQGWIGYAIPIAIFAIVMSLRLRRMGRMRPLKLGSLWVIPAIYLVVAALMFALRPPTLMVSLASLIGLALGAALGWQRGKMMHIHVDPETHALNQKASPTAVIFLMLLVLIKMGARGLAGGADGANSAMITDPLIAFALGMLSLTRLEMYIRARRLLDEARTGV